MKTVASSISNLHRRSRPALSPVTLLSSSSNAAALLLLLLLLLWTHVMHTIIAACGDNHALLLIISGNAKARWVLHKTSGTTARWRHAMCASRLRTCLRIHHEGALHKLVGKSTHAANTIHWGGGSRGARHVSAQDLRYRRTKTIDVALLMFRRQSVLRWWWWLPKARR